MASKSRSIWSMKSDRNIRYFQKIANLHKRSNIISRLVVRGEDINEMERITIDILKYYPNLFRETDIFIFGNH